jgi:hypothetical protein
MGTHGSPLTRVSTLPDRRARPTRRPVDLLVGPARPDVWAQGHHNNLEYKKRQTNSDSFPYCNQLGYMETDLLPKVVSQYKAAWGALLGGRCLYT